MKIKKTVMSNAIEVLPILAVFGIVGAAVFFVSKAAKKFDNLDLSFSEDKWNFRK